MRKKLFIVFLSLFGIYRAQNLYFPPTGSAVWDTIQPSSLGFCQSRIDSLYNYLQSKGTKSFILIKNGKIVLEKYYGTYTADSIHYWASAGKSLTGFLMGIAQQKGYVNISDKVSDYLGNNWSSAPLVKENLITVADLLKMTSGLNENPPAPCTNEDSAKACLTFSVNAGTYWAYHTGAYKQLQAVISKASGLTSNAFTNAWIESKIGMSSGFWYNGVFYSKARDMARFGLLNLNKGIWLNDTVLKDTTYFKNMVNTSQNFNLSYGYLWWLNGKASSRLPGVNFNFTGPLVPNAPSDMFCALGKNDQKIYVVPSQNVVVVRQGNSAGTSHLALSAFDNVIWDYINKLNCSNIGIPEIDPTDHLVIGPNPTEGVLRIQEGFPVQDIASIRLYASMGNEITLPELKPTDTEWLFTYLPAGLYYMEINMKSGKRIKRKIVKL